MAVFLLVFLRSCAAHKTRVDPEMPIYEYRCTHCGHQLDALQKVSDEPLKVCPKCSESALVKKISAAGFRLKGGGWYETDFKSGKKRNVMGDGGGDGKSDAGAKESGGGASGESGGSSGGGGEKKSNEGSKGSGSTSTEAS
jgi:putative FmdB family regulatory protein